MGVQDYSASEMGKGAATLVRPKSLQDMRKEHIKQVLEESQGDLAEAARILEITPRQLRTWMTKLGIPH